MDFDTGLSYAKDIGSLLSSAKGLFGGGGDDKPEWKSMRDQVNWSLYSAKHMPNAQVMGLREAGLNPMLAVGKGISAPPPVTSSPGADTNASTSRQLAQASIAQAGSQTALNLASARNVEADTQNKKMLPGKTGAETDLLGVQKQLAESEKLLRDSQKNSEDHRTGILIAEKALKDFEWLVTKTYGPEKAGEVMKQVRSDTAIRHSESQIKGTEAATAKGLEEAYKTLPAEYVSIVRILKSLLGR